MLPTRSSMRPLRSMASMVLAKVGGDASFATRSICARCSDIACSSAGLKCSTLTWSKGGTPPWGPDQLGISGFCIAGLLDFGARVLLGQAREQVIDLGA